MKVYGWIAMAHPRHGFTDRQVRAIVAAKSLAAASRASESVGLGKIHRDYCSPTGNTLELETALAQPGVVFARGIDDYKRAYRALESK